MSRPNVTGPPGLIPTPGQLPVFERKGQLVADSRDVAAMMERDHYELLKSIRTYAKYLIEGKIPVNDFFLESSYKDSIGRELPCYLITQKGCDMLANKLTGKKGVLFTAAYVTAFYAMREELTKRKVLRLKGKPIRRSLTNALRDSGEVERMKGHAYGTYTNLAYKLATGRTAGQLRRERGAGKEATAADILTSEELTLYQRKEAAITALLDAGLTYDTIKSVLRGEISP